MLGGQEKDVREATATFTDPRSRPSSDDAGWTIQAFRPVLGIRVPAWDLYLIYGPDAHWEGNTPPTPSFWMHQLRNVDNGPELDPEALGEQIRQTLAAIPR